MRLAWHALPALGADGALLSNSKRVDPHGRFPGRPWALARLFPGAAMVGDDRDIRNRVAHVVAQLRQISEGSGRIDARDTWLTVTLAIAELESLLAILRKRLP